MSSLSFEINLAGNFAAALEKSSTGLEKHAGHTKHAAHELELFEAEIEGVKGGLGGLEVNFSALAKGGSFFTFDLAEGLHFAYEILEKVVDGFVDLGKEMIQVAASTQDLNLAVELTMGKEGAKEIDELAESFAATTRFSAAQMKEAWLPLLDIGVKEPKLIDDLSTAAADIAARTHGGISKVQEVLGTFRGMMLKDQISKKTFDSLGITSEHFYADLSSQLHVSAATAEKMAKAHSVKSEMLVNTALHQVVVRNGGLGAGALAANETLGATLDHLHMLKETMFEGIANSPGMRSVNDFLKNFIETMKGPIGTDLVRRLSDGFTRLFGDLSGPGGVQRLGAAVQRIGDTAITFVNGLTTALPALIDKVGTIVTLAEVFATIWAGQAVITGITLIAGALPVLATVLGTVAGAGTLAGGALTAAFAPFLAIAIPVAAMLGGIVLTLGAIGVAVYRIVGAVKELGGLRAVWNDFKSMGDVVATSKGNPGFAAMQAQNAANLAKGRSSGALSLADTSASFSSGPGLADSSISVPALAAGGIVTGPMLALIGEAGPEAVIPLSSGTDSMGGTMHVTYAPVFHITSNGEEGDVKQQMAEAEQSWRIEFKKILDEAGATFGVTSP